MRKNILHLLILSFTALISFLSCKKQQVYEDFAANKPPIAIAGPDRVITLPIDSVLLDGSASNDQDGRISEWLWTKISGPASFTFINSFSAKAVIKNLIAGVYQFELKVTDNGRMSTKDTLQIIVNDSMNPNGPPIANNCFEENLNWSLDSIGMMTLINPDAIAGTLDCAGYGAEFLIPFHYDVWVQYEGSRDWVHLDYVFSDAIYQVSQNIFLSSTIYNEPTGNDGPVSVPIVYAKPNSGIDFTKKVTVINTK